MSRRLWLLTLAPAVFGIEPVRHLVESRMGLHMLLQFPLLAAAGAAAAQGLLRAVPSALPAWRSFDGDGLFAVVAVSAVSALWMLPVALDAALLHGGIALAKYLSWWGAGAALGLSWPAMRAPMRLFLAGNLAWMLATAGLLYAEAEQRLCVSYRYDEQAWTGAALCAVAAGLLLHGVWSALRAPAGQAVPA